MTSWSNCCGGARRNTLGRVGTYDIARSGIGYLFAFFDAQQSSAFGRLLEGLGRAQARLYCCTGELLDDIASGKLLIGYNLAWLLCLCPPQGWRAHRDRPAARLYAGADARRLRAEARGKSASRKALSRLPAFGARPACGGTSRPSSSPMASRYPMAWRPWTPTSSPASTVPSGLALRFWPSPTARNASGFSTNGGMCLPGNRGVMLAQRFQKLMDLNVFVCSTSATSVGRRSIEEAP